MTPAKKKEKKKTHYDVFSKLRHFIRWDIGKYREKGDTDTYQPFEGRTEKVST